MLRNVKIAGTTFWYLPTGAVTLGNKPDSTTLSIDDNQRPSALYILGKPRMGKSWLMVNMILQDIENGHGVFFLDPHGDAIDDLINRTHSSVILLDPEDERFCFGINPLACAILPRIYIFFTDEDEKACIAQVLCIVKGLEVYFKGHFVEAKRQSIILYPGVITEVDWSTFERIYDDQSP